LKWPWHQKQQGRPGQAILGQEDKATNGESLLTLATKDHYWVNVGVF
jgi:hypothetical protein